MKAALAFLGFALVAVVSAAEVQVKTAPAFSNKYTIKGTLYIPYAEIREPFYAWFDSEAGNSRIDYYGGMVKTYQLGKEGPNGVSRKLAPVTTETQLNEETCLQVDGSADNSVTPQSILPDLTGFECIGEDMVSGHQAEKWRLVTKKGDKVNKYTIWIRYKNNPLDPTKSIAVPMRYEMRGFNSLLGSHYDHYYLEYDWYSFEGPDSTVFQLPDNMTCTGFPGPGDKHIYTFNPMKEFIHNYEDHVDNAFENFKRAHKKAYVDNNEHGKRKDIFRQNLRYIHSKNRAGLGFQLAVNHLADKSELELKALRGKQYSQGYNGGQPFPYTNLESLKVPESMDWRIYGAVTPVKDQSVCGSCWSFGTTGAIEGAYFVKYGHLVRISQQALIDCSWGYGNNGCDGGEDFRSYQWMMKHGGIPTEEEYGPYLGQDGYCHADNVTLTAKITGYVNVTSGSVDALKAAVAKHGPISVAIDASHRTFSFYSNGVYYEPQCGNRPEQLDHAVLVVGYGTIKGKGYWLVKNSWSNYWGNDGYVLMAQQDNNCGVTTDPTYVTM
ncbi:digestive cysteine proteinase 1 [Neocloeon triangulifer]|uniref:digestive cysteine proteinase 1 n=1 Tax=Neocloeon triangulifer TaxID=2078957 RepID=UPI00286F72C0|nr:digestive cysteine proteinase 1 [Neocloeon triangulifer]XP_059485651.1 digestive cysteine proteinase 1 [Neocloeon triangulifer]